MKQENKEAFDAILDCFGGVDGGVSFVKLKALLEHMEADESVTGDKVVNIMLNFAKLVNYAGKL